MQTFWRSMSSCWLFFGKDSIGSGIDDVRVPPNRTSLLVIAAILILVGPAVGAPSPNFVVIVADDLGFGDLGCYGHKVVQSPHLDRLAADGVRLTSCYAGGTVCSPSRAALLTGRGPTRSGIHEAIPMLSPMHLKREEITIATLLRRAGYATAHVGKWHLNGLFNDPAHPQPNDHGFEYWFGTQNVALPNHQNPINFVRNGKPLGELKGYAADIVTHEAVHWLNERRDKDKPFFLQICFYEPHEPIATDKKFSDLYSFPGDPGRAAHHGNITQLDAAFGRLLGALEAEGLAGNTLVFFTSDNGPALTPMHPYGSAGPLRAKKAHLYEGGIRVPGIVRWPGKLEPGTVCDEPVSGVDLLPTLCAIAGVALPKDRKIDGINILPLLEGKSVSRPTPLYWHYARAASPPQVALRDGDWKIVARLKEPGAMTPPSITEQTQRAFKEANLKGFELYNLRNDVAENDDRAKDEADRLKTMIAKIEKISREARDESPVWEAWAFENYDGPRIIWAPYWKPGVKK